jgi:hypothetical protein
MMEIRLQLFVVSLALGQQHKMRNINNKIVPKASNTGVIKNRWIGAD